MVPYQFGRCSFSGSLWIKNGDLFSRVTLVDVELENPGAFKLEVVSQQGAVISQGTRDNPRAGWSTFDFTGGMIPPVSPALPPYKLRFVNLAGHELRIRSGNVHF